jgi:dihydroorotate dehydrogenase (NAD+) catalytic subunit
VNLEQRLFGALFHNPVLLASGTCGYGKELDTTFDIDMLGGIVTKAVTVLPREGNPALRVADFDAGMLNSVGLANVGLDEVIRSKLPWLANRLTRARVFVNVAGMTVAEFGDIVSALEPHPGYLGFELNVSCPNTEAGGAIFATQPDMLAAAVRAARAATTKPLLVKLAPNVPDIAAMAEIAVAEGADGLTLVNTMPGLLYDPETKRPLLGAGNGGMSGPALLPIGVHAVRMTRRRLGPAVPLLGVGGIRTACDAIQYFLAGASLVQIGTASFADPRAALRVLSGLAGHGRAHGLAGITELVGAGVEA